MQTQNKGNVGVDICVRINGAQHPFLYEALRTDIRNVLKDHMPEFEKQAAGHMTLYQNGKVAYNILDASETVHSLSKQVAAVNRINQIAGRSHPFNDWGNMKAQASINLEEAKEILVACEEQDFYKLRDSLADNRVTLFGFYAMCDLPLDDDFDEVVKCLYSRFDLTEELFEQTKAHWETKGLKVSCHRTAFMNPITDAEPEPSETSTTYWVAVSAEDQWLGENFYPKGKFLKSKFFKEPVFSDWPSPLSEKA